MSEFEKFIEDNFKELKSRIESGNFFAKTMRDSMHATWLKQQSEIDQLKAEKAGLEKLIKDWRKSANWMCATDDKHVINSLRSCADDLEKALRGGHE